MTDATTNFGGPPQRLTTSPTTFVLTGDTVDLSGPGLAWVGVAYVASVADGETFGAGAGNLAGAWSVEVSEDGTTWATATVVGQKLEAGDAHHQLSGSGHHSGGVYSTPRYLRVNLAVNDDAAALYAGANHPTVTLDVIVKRVTR